MPAPGCAVCVITTKAPPCVVPVPPVPALPAVKAIEAPGSLGCDPAAVPPLPLDMRIGPGVPAGIEDVPAPPGLVKIAIVPPLFPCGTPRWPRLPSVMETPPLPPDPPPGHGPHRYCFQVFALDAAPKLHGSPIRTQVAHAMKGHVIAKGLLVGTYERA